MIGRRIACDLAVDTDRVRYILGMEDIADHSPISPVHKPMILLHANSVRAIRFTIGSLFFAQRPCSHKQIPLRLLTT